MLQSYVGVKIVQAELEERNGEPGYAVIYPDGYRSWSPKEIFESAYLALEDPTKITPSVVDGIIADVEGRRVDPKTTLVAVRLRTGFVLYEAASCVDPENYDHQIGIDVGVGRIKDALWKCLGFVLQWGRFGLNA